MDQWMILSKLSATLKMSATTLLIMSDTSPHSFNCPKRFSLGRSFRSVKVGLCSKKILQKACPSLFRNINLILKVAAICSFRVFYFPAQIFYFCLKLGLLILEQFFPRAGFHVVGVRICVLQSVPTLGQELCSIEQILPVNPCTAPRHHFLRDSVLDFLQRHSLEFHRFRMIFPPFEVVEVFLESFPCLGMSRLMGDIWILLVP